MARRDFLGHLGFELANAMQTNKPNTEKTLTESEKVEWKDIDSAPKDGTTIVANYGTLEQPETALICWSQRPVCMLGNRNGGFPPGWATSPDSEADTNLPMDPPIYWAEYYQ